MSNDTLLDNLIIESSTKIVLLVVDGLGGLPEHCDGLTELETAKTPNLDILAHHSICGMIEPLTKGLTPGSGPAHLALFGYDPFSCVVGRGVLAAMGIGFDLQPSDVAVRINFASINEKGTITDRRAGRISTEKNERLCGLLSDIELPDVHVFVKTVKEHRAMAVFRGEGLSGALKDSDPQKTEQIPINVTPLSGFENDSYATKTAKLANEFIFHAKSILRNHAPANYILLRGFDQYIPLPSMWDRYKLKAAAVAVYPMYKGVARLLGMDILSTGETISDEIKTLTEHFEKYAFFFFHVKKTDSAGEDGNFKKKVQILEELDTLLPDILKLRPDVLIVTGDHSTPSVLKAHSWHTVPIILNSKYCRPDSVTEFSEKACNLGGLGRFSATRILPLALANALKLNKFGA